MRAVVQDTVNAISSGGLYALFTLGLGLLFSVMRLVNFAYGELLMVGGFVMVYLRDAPFVVLVVATLAAVIATSVITERVGFRPLRNADPMTLLLASFAVSVILQNGARMAFGPRPKGVPPYDFLDHQIVIGSVRFAVLDVITIAVTGACIFGMFLVLKRTKLGLHLRAAAEDFEMARVLGVKANRVIASAFAVTGVLGGVAALILTFQQGGVTITVGSTPVLIAFVAVVIGGMGSLPGAALGGFLLGAATALLNAVLPGDLGVFRDAFLFSAVIAVLLLRPQGLIPQPVPRV